MFSSLRIGLKQKCFLLLDEINILWQSIKFSIYTVNTKIVIKIKLAQNFHH